jgi:hypothetical protein
MHEIIFLFNNQCKLVVVSSEKYGWLFIYDNNSKLIRKNKSNCKLFSFSSEAGINYYLLCEKKEKNLTIN